MYTRKTSITIPIYIAVRSASQSNTSTTYTTEIEIDGGAASTVDQIDSLELSEPPSLESILDEVGDIQAGANYANVPRTLATFRPTPSAGPQEIIRDMDTDRTDGIRHRRVATNSLPTQTANASSSTHDDEAAALVIPPHNSEDKIANTDNCTNENNENGNVIEDIALETTIGAPFSQVTSATPRTVETQLISCTSGDGSDGRENEFRIKLKYLNDDLKLVKGCPSETIGDFKK